MDATLIETHKKEALYCYEVPIVPAADDVLGRGRSDRHSEFRDGTCRRVPAVAGTQNVGTRIVEVD